MCGADWLVLRATAVPLRLRRTSPIRPFGAKGKTAQSEVQRVAGHHWMIGSLTLAAVGIATPGVAGTPPPDVEISELRAYLGFSDAQAQELLAGKIISTQLPRSAEETELALAVAATLPTSLDDAHALVVSGETLRLDRNIDQWHEITGWPARAEDFTGIEFTVDESTDAVALLRFDGGTEFNLDSAEIARFRTLRGRFTGAAADTPEAREAVSTVYREILMERYRAYRTGGMAAIAPYFRSRRKQIDPARTLQLAAGAATFFRDNEPALYDAFTKFPNSASPDVEHRFYWLKQRVQDRPTFVLSHRMLTKRPGHAVLADRQYYIGHSYNTVQIVTGVLPVNDADRGGEIVAFYTNRTSIDQLAGMTGPIARPIASGKLSARVVERFESFRARATP